MTLTREKRAALIAVRWQDRARIGAFEVGTQARDPEPEDIELWRAKGCAAGASWVARRYR